MFKMDAYMQERIEIAIAPALKLHKKVTRLLNVYSLRPLSLQNSSRAQKQHRIAIEAEKKLNAIMQTKFLWFLAPIQLATKKQWLQGVRNIVTKIKLLIETSDTISTTITMACFWWSCNHACRAISVLVNSWNQFSLMKNIFCTFIIH